MTDTENASAGALRKLIQDTSFSKFMRIQSILIWFAVFGFFANVFLSGYETYIFAYLSGVISVISLVWIRLVYTLVTSDVTFGHWRSMISEMSMIGRAFYFFFCLISLTIIGEAGLVIVESIQNGMLTTDIILLFAVMCIGMMFFMPLQSELQNLRDNSGSKMLDPSSSGGSSHAFTSESDDQSTSEATISDHTVIKSEGGVRVLKNESGEEAEAEELPEEVKQGIRDVMGGDMIVQQFINQKSNPYMLNEKELELLDEHDAVDKYFAVLDERSD